MHRESNYLAAIDRTFRNPGINHPYGLLSPFLPSWESYYVLERIPSVVDQDYVPGRLGAGTGLTKTWNLASILTVLAD